MKAKTTFTLALLGAFALTTSVAWAQQKNWNSAKSNTSTAVYPGTEDDCTTSGGTWLVSKGKNFCYLELKADKDGEQTKACEEAGGIVVTEEDVKYCEPTDSDLKGAAKQARMKGDFTRSTAPKR